MGEGILIKVVDVRYAKVQWGSKDENRFGNRRPNQEMQREYERAKQQFLCQRTGDVISPANPATQGFMEISSVGPVSPSGFDDAFLEDGPGEEKCGEKKDLSDVEGGERIPA